MDTTVLAGPDDLTSFDESVIRVDEISLDLAIQQSEGEFYCQGRATAQVMLECARCLSEYETEITAKADFIICSADDAASRSGSDSELYVSFQGNALTVDIVEPVRQALVLAMSMKPVCSDDCRGLCQSCGVNLNEKSCDCKIETTDPRWDGLSDLLPE